MAFTEDIEPDLNTSGGDDSSMDGQPAPETVGDDAPAPESLEASTKTPGEPNAEAVAQAVADLSKFKEVTIDGQKMTLDELKKSIMRQSDYTKKTQELARQRQEFDSQREKIKFESNYKADLDKVAQNPQLLREFLRIYPKEYHARLKSELASLQSQQPTQSNVNNFEIEERLSRYDQFIEEQNKMKVEAEQQAIDATLKSIETELQKKYPRADIMTVYALAEQYSNQRAQETGQKLTSKDITTELMEPFFKRSHEFTNKQFNDWQKEQAKQAQGVHKRASDVGRGGGTPGQPAKKLKLKDVADEILRGGNF